MSRRPDLVLDRPAPARPGIPVPAMFDEVSTDVLDGLLTTTAPQSIRPARLMAGGRWAVRFGHAPYAKVITVLSGACWLRVEGREPVRLHAGACYLTAPESAYVVASDLGVRPEPSDPLFARATTGVATTGQENDTQLIGGTIDVADATTATVLDGIEPIAITEPATAAAITSTLLQLADEHQTNQPGSQAMSRHLTRILHLQLARHLLATGNDSPRRLAAIHDPRIGAAMAAVDAAPARRWTVASLAAQASMSRTVFAERFKAVVGLSVMEYVLRRRIAGATADLTNGRTVAATASRWGYSSESAFSSAFKRVTGTTPASTRRS